MKKNIFEKKINKIPIVIFNKISQANFLLTLTYRVKEITGHHKRKQRQTNEIKYETDFQLFALNKKKKKLNAQYIETSDNIKQKISDIYFFFLFDYTPKHYTNIQQH